MSEQARKMFDIDEQLAKDLIRTIEIISPVIPVIRNWGQMEQVYLEASSQRTELNKQLNHFRKTIGFLSEDDVTRQSLEAKCVQLQQEIREVDKKAKSLKKSNAQSEEDVVNYQRYVKNKIYGNHIWNRALGSVKIDNEKALCILFVIHAVDALRGKREILEKYFKDYPIELTDDWNRFLDYVKYN